MTQVGSLNLDALHDSEGGHLYTAKLTTGYQYVMSQLIPRSIGGVDSSFMEPQERGVKDPSETCLQNMLVLAEGDSSTPANQAAQVRHFTWYALRDPSLLSRERALHEVGLAAARLQLGSPTPPPETTASAVELSEALVALVDALRPILVQGDAASAEELAALEAACAKMEALSADLEGGRRVLRAIENLTRGRDGGERAFAPLYRLNRAVQTQVVRRVLTESLGDSHQVVRAAAIEANWRAYGDPFLLFQLLDLERNFVRRLSQNYAVEDVVRLFEIVRLQGLPTDPDADPLEAAKLRFRLLLLLTNVAISVGDFDERVRAAAMRALGSVSDAGFESLRFEDWSAWWQANEERLKPPEPLDGESEP